jgi:DNA-directed RNA polymerase subunit L
MEVKVNSFLDKKDFSLGYLKLSLKGKNINHVYVNTLRRVILEDIPSYGINPELININKNSSVYNNDYLRNRLENFPLIGLDFKLDLEEYNDLRKYMRGVENYVKEYEESNINMYLDIKNNEDYIRNVTTDDMKFYMNDNSIKSIYKNKLLICKLKKDEEINLSIKVDKGVGLNHSRYSVAHVYYEEKNNNYLFTIEPRGQLNVKEILIRACIIIKYKLNLIKEKINMEKIIDDGNGVIVLNNEDHTIGNLLTYTLQENNNISFAGYELEHLLIKDLKIKYSIIGKKSIKEILNSEIDNLVKYYNNLEIEFSKLKL